MSDQPPAPPPAPQAHPQMQYPAPAVPVAPDGRPLADPGQRLGARLIDTVVYLVATVVLAGLTGAVLVALLSTALGDDSPVVPATAITVIVLVIIGLQYVYEVEIPLRWGGRTPGKRVLGIAVIAMEPGRPLSRGTLAYRFVVMLGFNLLSNCWVGLIDPLWCLWDKPYRQCLHDKPAKTLVVQSSSNSSGVRSGSG